MTSHTTERFTDRVENYVRYRPGYPPEMIGFMRDELGLSPDWTVADIGSGTGISSRVFLENGNRLFGVEPNDAMRSASSEYLKDYSHFTPMAGTADATGLKDNSVDIVFAAQSFHWFCNTKAVAEFQRILKPRGVVALAWNERETKIDKFHIDFEALLLRFGTDYDNVRHDKITADVLNRTFETSFRQETFCYQQLFDLEGLKGRVMSSSYIPAEGDENFAGMMNDLEALFAVYAEMGKITVLYKTKFFYCSL